ncbi:MAG: hypothetical protein BWY41_00037 [Candidatus Atribacteria bacterium ADurb.Bin276]|uniref:Uncharacterized protein n=1 Tax=Candidatus Atribacter allofermentans TaxID=1852833 RepID=A0A1V5T4E5_9BACT|nr:MAG: hypothetical protein BWY41_00037 [Candidatus Atribacteria bacterium ADurb.Bin276]
MKLEPRIKKLEDQTSPVDWSKVKIYDWSSTPEELEELARQEAAGETVIIRIKLLKKEEEPEPPGPHFNDVKLKPGQKIAIAL